MILWVRCLRPALQACAEEKRIRYFKAFPYSLRRELYLRLPPSMSLPPGTLLRSSASRVTVSVDGTHVEGSRKLFFFVCPPPNRLPPRHISGPGTRIPTGNMARSHRNFENHRNLQKFENRHPPFPYPPHVRCYRSLCVRASGGFAVF